MLKVSGVSKFFDTRQVLHEISFSLEKGDVLGLLGLNGAGKTTLLKGIAGVFPFSSGKVTYRGISLAWQPTKFRGLLGYQPEKPYLEHSLSVLEHARLVAALHGLPNDIVEDRISESLDFLELAPLRHCPCGDLSKGEQQRVTFLLGTLHQPDLLLLDEPMNGLDPKQMMAFRKYIDSGKDQRITILSTHLLSEVKLVCNKILVLHEGRVTVFKDHIDEQSITRLERYFVHQVPGKEGESGDQMVVHQ